MKSYQQEQPSRTCARAGVPKAEGLVYTSNKSTSRTRAYARTREEFYGPAIIRELDAAVDYALEVTRNRGIYRRAWCFYCLRLGINTFLDQLDAVMACARQGEIRKPAQAFHARLRKLTTARFGQVKATGGEA